MKDLSRRQRSILDFIEQFLEANDYPPTIRDIQRDLNISSTSVVDYNLKVLEREGRIRRDRAGPSRGQRGEKQRRHPRPGTRLEKHHDHDAGTRRGCSVSTAD